MRYFVTVGERVIEVDLGADGIRVDGRRVEAKLIRTDGTPVRGLRVGGTTHRLVAERGARGAWKLHVGPRAMKVDIVDERTKSIREVSGLGPTAVGPRPIVAPMPGLVVKVEVSEGDIVQMGQGIVIVEAMKMENELRAQGPGRVSRVHVSRGQTVEKDQVLVDFEPIEAGP